MSENAMLRHGAFSWCELMTTDVEPRNGSIQSYWGGQQKKCLVCPIPL